MTRAERILYIILFSVLFAVTTGGTIHLLKIQAMLLTKEVFQEALQLCPRQQQYKSRDALPQGADKVIHLEPGIVTTLRH